MKIVFRFVVASLPILAVLLFFVEMVSANQLASIGNSVRTIDMKIALLQEENEVLQQQVAMAMSLTTVESKAKALGFVESKQIMTIGQDQFRVAIRPVQ